MATRSRPYTAVVTILPGSRSEGMNTTDGTPARAACAATGSATGPRTATCLVTAKDDQRRERGMTVERLDGVYGLDRQHHGPTGPSYGRRPSRGTTIASAGSRRTIAAADGAVPGTTGGAQPVITFRTKFASV